MNGPATGRGSLTVEDNTYSSFNGKPGDKILLAKVIVEVQKKSGENIPCR